MNPVLRPRVALGWPMQVPAAVERTAGPAIAVDQRVTYGLHATIQRPLGDGDTRECPYRSSWPSS